MSAVVADAVLIRHLGLVPYVDALARMREFTAGRDPSTPDELWVLEHPPVYTLGLAADRRHGPREDSGIPLVQVERGGEVTYHGPGQAVVYTLVDLGRRGIKVREFVCLLEQSVIDLLGEHGVAAQRRTGAPGVYAGNAKVAALGIRVTRGRALHGLALNVDMDLAPFARINPCGMEGLPVTQTRSLGIAEGASALGMELAALLAARIDRA